MLNESFNREKCEREIMKKILFMVFLLVLLTGSTSFAKEPVEVEYYYYNPCENCEAEETYEKEFRKAVADVADEDDYTLQMKDVGSGAYYEEYMQLVEGKKANGASPGSALLVIGDKYLFGMNQITEEARDVMIRELYEEISIEEALECMEDIDPSDSFLVYFYMPECSSCQKVEGYLEAMDREVYVEETEEMSRVKTMYINLGNLEMVPLANWFYEKYQVNRQDRKAPVIFYQNGYLQGFEDIRDGLPSLLRKGQARGWQNPDYQESDAEGTNHWKEWGVLVLTGLVNGLNPCGISVLLLLISLLLAKKENVLKLGLAFILAKFLTYLLLGVTFGTVFSQMAEMVIEPVWRVLKWALVVAFLCLAFLNLGDFVLARREKYGKMKLQLPASLRKFHERYLGRILNKDSRSLTWLVFLAGIVVSAGEFLCTGQLYLASILYVMERQESFAWATFGELAVYVACMCVPLVLAVAAVNRGRALFYVSELERKKIWLVKLLYGGAFLLFAVLMLMM